MGKIIAIANHKGGVAKTTTTINLGAALVLKGKKVLLVDIDPQCNLTETMYTAKTESTIYQAMLGLAPVQPVKLIENFYLIPSDKDLNAADIQIGSVEGAQLLLKKILDPLRDEFDYILIDCPPSRAIVTVNGLSAADEVIIPTLAEILSVRGIKDMTELIDLVRENINRKLKIAGLLIVMYSDRTSAARQTVAYIDCIADHIGTKLFNTRVRKNVTIVESQLSYRDIFRENASAKAAQDYMELAEEVLASE